MTETLADKLKTARMIAGLSQEEAAERSRIGSRGRIGSKTISAFETGSRASRMRLDQLEKLLYVYGFTLADFFSVSSVAELEIVHRGTPAYEAPNPNGGRPKQDRCKRGHDRLNDANIYKIRRPNGTIERRCKACANMHDRDRHYAERKYVQKLTVTSIEEALPEPDPEPWQERRNVEDRRRPVDPLRGFYPDSSYPTPTSSLGGAK